MSGEIPSAKVYEDDDLVAFKDITPQAPLHVLIVPRTHVATLNDLTPAHDALVGAMARRAAAIAPEPRTRPMATSRASGSSKPAIRCRRKSDPTAGSRRASRTGAVRNP